MNLKQFFFVPAMCLLFVCVLLTSCSNTKVITTPDGGKVTVQGNGDGSTFTATGDNGAKTTMTTGSAAVFPANFPLPQYPQSKVQFAVGQEGAAAGGASAVQSTMLLTNDSVDKVAEYYVSWLNSNGWKIDTQFKADGQSMIAASKGDQTAQVSSASSNNETTITLGMQNK